MFMMFLDLSELYGSESRVSKARILEPRIELHHFHPLHLRTTWAFVGTELYLFAEACFASFREISFSGLCTCAHRSAHHCDNC